MTGRTARVIVHGNDDVVLTVVGKRCVEYDAGPAFADEVYWAAEDEVGGGDINPIIVKIREGILVGMRHVNLQVAGGFTVAVVVEVDAHEFGRIAQFGSGVDLLRHAIFVLGGAWQETNSTSGCPEHGLESGGKAHGGAPVALRVAVVGAHLGGVGGFGGEVGQREGVAVGLDEVGLVVVEADLPSGGLAVLRPAEGDFSVYAFGVGHSQVRRDTGGVSNAQSEVGKISGKLRVIVAI